MEATAFDSKLDLASGFDAEESYNPLDFIEGEDDEDWMDDDGLLLPSALPPKTTGRKRPKAVYSPETTGSVSQAVRNLVTTNAARRHALLSIIDWAREGERASVLFRKIEKLQEDNRSVYEPVSYCRMLERAGALRLELRDPIPAENADAKRTSCEASPSDMASIDLEEAAAEGIEYLSIEEDVDPVWRSTDEGMQAYEELVQGDEWREKVLGSDSRYAEVYLAIMHLLLDGGKPKGDIVDAAQSFEVTKKPLKLGAYFIDVLEATCAIRWEHASWNLTELGKALLPELEVFCEQVCQTQDDSSLAEEEVRNDA